MGHPERFPLKYVTVGNEDCDKINYKGNFLLINMFKNYGPICY